MKSREVPQVNSPVMPLLLNDEQAAGLLGIGTSYFRRLVQDGTIGPIPVALGKRRLHRRDLLEKWVWMGLPRRTDPTWQQATHKISGSTTVLMAPCGGAADAVSAGGNTHGR